MSTLTKTSRATRGGAHRPLCFQELSPSFLDCRGIRLIGTWRKQVSSRVIKKVLISNNGVAAVKAIRSIRSWAYEVFGNERAISFVVMATPEDLRSVNMECHVSTGRRTAVY